MPKPPSHFITKLPPKLANKLKQDLQDQSFTLSQPPYTLFSGKKKGLTVTLYASYKLMIQGKNLADFVTYYLEPELLETFTFGYEEDKTETDSKPHIGIDESGKGDFFGPLCVGGLYADESGIKNLKKIGVKDSKKMTDKVVLRIAAQLKKEYSHHIVKINPLKYNDLIEKFGNLNLLLGWGHATCIDALIEKTGCQRVTVDQFAAEHVVESALKKKKRKATITQRPRAEEDLVVAAASILARAAFLQSIADLEKSLGQKLPKGASQATIQAGRQLVRTHGENALQKVGKLHFKTLTKILA